MKFLTILLFSACLSGCAVKDAACGAICDTEACAGDCDGNGKVTSAEVVDCSELAAGNAANCSVGDCDANGDNKVDATDVSAASANAARGCP